MTCPLTGAAHRLFWMRSAWWCDDCRQKIETCCEGACPSLVEVLGAGDGGVEEAPSGAVDIGRGR